MYAGGNFTTIGGVSANKIAKWDGSGWSALGTGADTSVRAIAVNGSDVYAGGDFTTIGGVSTKGIAKWDGSSWSALGTGANGYVYAIAVNGSDVYVGGSFTTIGGVSANYIAKWDGNSWSALGTGANGYVRAIAVSGSNVYVGGSFTLFGEVSANRIAKWDGGSWSALGTGVGSSSNYVRALALDGSDVYVGGYFTSIGGVSAKGIAKWNGSSWSALGAGTAGYVYAIAVSGSDVYVGGNFMTIGGVSANHIAKWNGSSWQPIGNGVNNTVYCLAVQPATNSMIVGGHFTAVNGIDNGSKVAKFTDSDNSLPVELTSFTAQPSGNAVALAWTTESETENLGFIIQRRQETGEWKQVAIYTTDETLQGHGSTTEAHEYAYTDAAVQPGATYAYRLADVDYSGSVTWHQEVEIEVKAEDGQTPTVFGLQPAYPNPFNAQFTIPLTLKESMPVAITLYDIAGRVVKLVQDRPMAAGDYHLPVNAGGLHSGIYFVRITVGNSTRVEKIILMK